MNDKPFEVGRWWTAEDLAAVRAAFDAGELPAEVDVTGGGTVLVCVDEARDVGVSFGSGKARALTRTLLDLVRAGRKADLVVIEDPKNPAAPTQSATVGALAAAGLQAGPVGKVTIHQLTGAGVCWREFHHHPGTEAEREALYARIERGYRMAATMVTLDGQHQLGAHGTHAAAAPVASPRDITTATPTTQQRCTGGDNQPAGRTFTHPHVLTIGVRDGWADQQADPTRIDWAPRQATAAIPFRVIGGRPVNPCERTGIRYGRNELGHWGEGLAADALVTATDQDGRRWIVMVERTDGHGWAIPGGMVEPGEDPVAAARRELEEETQLRLDGVCWRAAPPRYVPDPRASDEAWMVTVLVRVDVGVHERDQQPEVVGADDAARAAWVRADDYPTLVDHVARTYGATVFPAHVGMLTEVLNTTDLAETATSGEGDR